MGLRLGQVVYLRAAAAAGQGLWLDNAVAYSLKPSVRNSGTQPGATS